MSATVPRRTRPPGDLAQTGVVALLLAVAGITWALTQRRMAWRRSEGCCRHLQVAN